MTRNGFTPFANFFDSVRPASERIGKVCAIFAAGVYERLDRIAENTGDKTARRRYTNPLVFTGAATKELEVPIGQCWRLALIAVSAATTVTIRSGGILQYVHVFAGADTLGPDVTVSAGAGTPISVSSSAAAEVTLHIDIVQRDDPMRGQSGEYAPAGMRTNAMELALEQHFPGILDPSLDPYHNPPGVPGSIYGAGSPTKNAPGGSEEGVE